MRGSRFLGYIRRFLIVVNVEAIVHGLQHSALPLNDSQAQVKHRLQSHSSIRSKANTSGFVLLALFYNQLRLIQQWFPWFLQNLNWSMSVSVNSSSNTLSVMASKESFSANDDDCDGDHAYLHPSVSALKECNIDAFSTYQEHPLTAEQVQSWRQHGVNIYTRTHTHIHTYSHIYPHVPIIYIFNRSHPSSILLHCGFPSSKWFH